MQRAPWDLDGAEIAPLDSLRLDERNARHHPRRNLDAIKSALSRFKQQRAIVVDREGTIIAGNGTFTAAQELGWTHIAVQRSDLVGDEARAFAIADNRTAELAEWDRKELVFTLAELESRGFSAEALGFFDRAGGGGAAAVGGLKPGLAFRVIVEVPTEEAQRMLMERLEKEGFKCLASVL